MKKLFSRQVTLSLMAIAAGILVGVIILMFTGKNPLDLFVALIRSTTGFYLKNGTFSARYIGEFLVTSIPIILTGLSVGFAYRTGLFNIGAEGQVIMGSLFATFVAVSLNLPAGIHAIVALLAGALGGALLAAIPGFLKTKFNINEVVVCIMLNYVAYYLGNYLTEVIDPMAIGLRRTGDIAVTASLKSDFLSSITASSRLHWGIVVALLAVVIYWFVIEKTTFGYSLRATGFNKDGAKFAGLKVNKNIVLSMMIAGAFAGLAGATLVTGVFGYGRVLASFENYGFDGIAVALVGSGNALGILFSGFLFAMLKNAQQTLQVLGLTKDIVLIVSSAIILFVAMKNGFAWFLDKMQNRKPKKIENTGEDRV